MYESSLSLFHLLMSNLYIQSVSKSEDYTSDYIPDLPTSFHSYCHSITQPLSFITWSTSVAF